MLWHVNDISLCVINSDRIPGRPEIKPVNRVVVITHVVVAFGAARVVVKRNAGADYVDK